MNTSHEPPAPPSPENSGRSRASLQRTTFANTAALQLAIAVDSGLRWSHGVGFPNSAWLLNVAPALGVGWFALGLLVRWQSPAWLSAIVAYPLVSALFLAASSGFTSFDWKDLPVLSFVTLDWSTLLGDAGGFRTAMIGSISVAILLGSYRHVARHKSDGVRQPERALLGLGAAWLLASSLRFTDLAAFHTHAPRLDAASMDRLSLIRTALWGSAGAVGLVALGRGILLRFARLYQGKN